MLVNWFIYMGIFEQTSIYSEDNDNLSNICERPATDSNLDFKGISIKNILSIKKKFSTYGKPCLTLFLLYHLKLLIINNWQGKNEMSLHQLSLDEWEPGTWDYLESKVLKTLTQRKRIFRRDKIKLERIKHWLLERLCNYMKEILKKKPPWRRI